VGELRRGLPVGLVWGDEDGEVRFDPDEAVTGAIRTVFERFAEFGSVRRVWLWFCSERLGFPMRRTPFAEIRWIVPTYTAIHNVLTNPTYAGAYTYGKTRKERFVDQAGHVRQRMRRLPRSEWSVLIPNHHPGFVDWQTHLDNLVRIQANTHPQRHQPGGALREGGRCSRPWRRVAAVGAGWPSITGVARAPPAITAQPGNSPMVVEVTA